MALSAVENVSLCFLGHFLFSLVLLVSFSDRRVVESFADMKSTSPHSHSSVSLKPIFLPDVVISGGTYFNVPINANNVVITGGQFNNFQQRKCIFVFYDGNVNNSLNSFLFISFKFSDETITAYIGNRASLDLLIIKLP